MTVRNRQFVDAGLCLVVGVLAVVLASPIVLPAVGATTNVEPEVCACGCGRVEGDCCCTVADDPGLEAHCALAGETAVLWLRVIHTTGPSRVRGPVVVWSSRPVDEILARHSWRVDLDPETPPPRVAV